MAQKVVRMSVKQVRDELADAVNLAHHGTPVLLTYHTRPWVVLLSLEQAERCLGALVVEAAPQAE